MTPAFTAVAALGAGVLDLAAVRVAVALALVPLVLLAAGAPALVGFLLFDCFPCSWGG